MDDNSLAQFSLIDSTRIQDRTLFGSHFKTVRIYCTQRDRTSVSKNGTCPTESEQGLRIQRSLVSAGSSVSSGFDPLGSNISLLPYLPLGMQCLALSSSTSPVIHIKGGCFPQIRCFPGTCAIDGRKNSFITHSNATGKPWRLLEAV